MHSARRCSATVVSVLLLVMGCATGSATSTPADSMDVDLRIEQLPDAGFAVEDRGAVSVAYQLTVQNRTTDPITLRTVEMKTTGRSPYTLRKDPASLNETIEPDKEALVTFTMWSYPQERRSNARQLVWVSGVAHFESAKGAFQKAFTQSFREP